MKIFTAQSNLPWHGERRPAGFTLIEVMFASALLIVVIMALLSAHLIGLRLDQLVESKAGASESSRRALNQLPMEIRSAKMWNIGNISGTNFVNLVDGQSQQGTALELFESTNGSQYILYYFDTNDVANSNGKLMRTVSTSWNPVVLASNLITSLYFREEDYNGNVSTLDGSKSYKYIIHTTLQFCQFQYPLTPVGTNGLYDYFKLEFKATPHLPE